MVKRIIDGRRLTGWRRSAVLGTASAAPAILSDYKRDAAQAITRPEDVPTGNGKPTRRDRKAMMRQVQAELTVGQRAQLDVSKLHPRWLRRLVQAELAFGATVTEEDIARWRKAGRK